MDNYTEAVLAQLRAEMAVRKMTAKDLAPRVGVHYATLLRYLSGERNLPVVVLGNILNTLGVGPGDFFERAGKLEGGTK